MIVANTSPSPRRSNAGGRAVALLPITSAQRSCKRRASRVIASADEPSAALRTNPATVIRGKTLAQVGKMGSFGNCQRSHGIRGSRQIPVPRTTIAAGQRWSGGELGTLAAYGFLQNLNEQRVALADEIANVAALGLFRPCLRSAKEAGAFDSDIDEGGIDLWRDFADSSKDDVRLLSDDRSGRSTAKRLSSAVNKESGANLAARRGDDQFLTRHRWGTWKGWLRNPLPVSSAKVSSRGKPTTFV